jgi:hypothetical protein
MIKDHRKFKAQEQLEFEDLDRNISSNLQELNQMRHEAEERKREQKRLEIMERMKKNEVRKQNEQRLVRANNQYVHQFKQEPHAEPALPKSPPK